MDTVFERPHPGLADSYRAMVREFTELGEELIPFTLEWDHRDFAAWVARLAACERGNAGSVGTILRCGGKFASEEFIPARGEVVQRYLIDLGPP